MSERIASMNSGSGDSSSRNLSIMAAAVEHMSSSLPVAPASSADAGPVAAEYPVHIGSNSGAQSPTRRSKLVLPVLTQAMQQDLALTKTAATKASKPLSIGTRPEYTDYALQGIVTPHPNDVLCGRGGGSNNHPGNESFRELVNEVKFPYVNCPKREKPLIARRIVEAVRKQTPPGRFLSKDSKTGLWIDIGDGKAREKTSQALREGAPIIREHMVDRGSPTNVAAVLKEAKKAERAAMEYAMKLPRKELEKNEDSHHVAPKMQGSYHHNHHVDTHATHATHAQPSPTLSNNEPTLIKRGMSMGSSPPNLALNNGNNAPAPNRLPPIKKYRSFGDQDANNHNNGQHPPTAWPPIPHQQPGRNFNMMPAYAHHHRGQMMGGYAPPPPPRGPPDYSNQGGAMPRYPSESSTMVPMETVRRLLLGQLDPVQLALQILPPEEAAVVARRHAAPSAVMPAHHQPAHHQPAHHHPGAGMMSRMGPPLPPPPGPSSAPPPPTHPLKLNPVVSDGSSTSSLGDSTRRQMINDMRRFPSDQSSSAAQGGGDDSSVDSSNRSNTSERALPKKKRKYVEEN